MFIYLYISLFSLFTWLLVNIIERFFFIKKFKIYSVDFDNRILKFTSKNNELILMLKLMGKDQNNKYFQNISIKNKCIFIVYKLNVNKRVLFFYGNKFNIMYFLK
jgi:hypothetical protein